MSAITLKNVPDEIYERLRETALAHRRSVNSEAIACLERVLLPSRITAQERLVRARKLRAELQRKNFKATDIAREIRRKRV